MTAIAKTKQRIGYAIAAVLSACAFLPSTAYAVTTNICGTGSTRCNKFIDDYLNPLILVLTALVGVIAVISIIVAGIQYAASADDPAMVSKAKQRIFNTVLGLLAYIFLFAFLNYLVPGGIL